MNKREKYRAHMPSDTGYIKGIAQSIKRADQQEDIPFELLTEALGSVGITNNSYEFVTANSFDAQAVNRIVDEAYERITKAELSDDVRKRLYALWDYLAEPDPLERAELIFVFGGGGETRPLLAAQLYKERWAPKILFTGRHASYMNDENISEAELFSRIACRNGVPPEDIILETQAKNTPENALYSVKILKEQGELPKTIILIQVEYQMRRAYLTFKAVANWKPRLIRCPAPSGNFKREQYWADKSAWSYVFVEFIKLYGARQMGHF